MVEIQPRSRGHLNPGDPRVMFDRFTLGIELADLVRHVWVVRWSVPAGQTLAQRVLTYPAFNAVFDDKDARLFPPAARVDVRRLSGDGWTVGVLLRPCAARVLLVGTDECPSEVPAEGYLLDRAPAVAIAATMAVRGESAIDSADTSRDRVARLLEDWIGPLVRLVDDRDRLVNRACAVAENDASVSRAAELADRVGVAPRTLERLMRDAVGLGPKWLIECRRLQDAATTLYTKPETDLSALAARLEYVDYPHFSRRYRTVLGETPADTRHAGRKAASTS
jgi:AraC-like DNA-binding protein